MIDVHLDTEQATLGSLLVDAQAIERVATFLEPGHFSLPSHQVVFAAMLDLYRAGRPTTVTLVAERLLATGNYEAVGGTAYLAGLCQLTDSSLYAEYYARQVAERGRLRELAAALSGLTAEAQAPDAELASIRRRVEEVVLGTARDTTARGRLLRDILPGTLTDVPPGISTGFSDLDFYTGGLQPGHLITIGASTGVGKTVMGLNLAHNIGVVASDPWPVLVISLEMTEEELTQRMVSLESNLPYAKVRQPSLLFAHERERLLAAHERLNGTVIEIDQHSDGTVADVFARARYFCRQHERVGFVLVDYLQRMKSPGQRNGLEEMKMISRGLKDIAHDLEVTVVAPAQLSRQVDQRPDRTPRLSDLRESGTIEHDSDQVWLLKRPGSYDREADDADITYVDVAKNRHGQQGTAQLLFHGKQMRLTQVSTRHDLPFD